MHGLVFCTLQAFVTDRFGADRWARIAQASELGFSRFEAMLDYDAELLPRVLTAASAELGRAEGAILEDVGTYLVTHPNHESVRRLMRFGGEDFIDFLHSLDDLPDRTRLAVSGLYLPTISLREHTLNQFTITCHGAPKGFARVLVGLLQAMADDYGALALLNHRSGSGDTDVVEVSVFETAFSEGRDFALAAQEGGAG